MPISMNKTWSVAGSSGLADSVTSVICVLAARDGFYQDGRNLFTRVWCRSRIHRRGFAWVEGSRRQGFAWLEGTVELGVMNFPSLSLEGNTFASIRGFPFFGSAWVGCRASLLRFGFCRYSSIASGLPLNFGSWVFAFFLGGWVGAIVSNSLVLFCNTWIRSAIIWSSSANGDESVGDESDCGWGGVDNTGYMLNDFSSDAIRTINWRFLKIKLERK